jgi:two-component sensor histidine kinase
MDYNEIHHRIKNNLNMIASIIGLQILNLEKTNIHDTKEILLNSKLRIEVVAMIHESLYQHNNNEEIDFKEYTKKLTQLILRTYNQDVLVKINTEVPILHEDIMLRLGIIINELFTNSIKHSFSKSNQKKCIKIGLLKKDKHYIFTYHNPYNINADLNKILHSDTLGIKLINLTVKQMGGECKVEQNEGLLFTITFKI